jgi:hypothetical protein
MAPIRIEKGKHSPSRELYTAWWYVEPMLLTGSSYHCNGVTTCALCAGTGRRGGGEAEGGEQYNSQLWAGALREREQGMWGSDRRIQLEDLRDVGLDRGITGKRRIR